MADPKLMAEKMAMAKAALAAAHISPSSSSAAAPTIGRAPWLHDTMSRDHAESLLRRFGMKQGLFLVRIKDERNSVYALTIAVGGGGVVHYLVEKPGKYFTVNSDPVGYCTSLVDLVQYLRLPREGYPYALISPVTVNSAEDSGTSEYLNLWESQTDDLYMTIDGKVSIDTSRGGVASGRPAQTPVRRHTMAARPAPRHDPGGFDVTDPAISHQINDAYNQNAQIATRARMGSTRRAFPKLSPEITGEIELAQPPVNTAASAMGPPGSNNPPAPLPYDEDMAPPLPPNHPSLKVDAGEKPKRRSTVSNFFASRRNKKKGSGPIDGLTKHSVRLLGSAHVSAASGEKATKEGVAKITFVTAANPSETRKATLGVSKTGFMIQSAEGGKTIFHQHPISELTYAFIDPDEATMFGIVATKPGTEERPAPSSFLMLMTADGCRGDQLFETVRSSLLAANCKIQMAGKTLSANDGIDEEYEFEGVQPQVQYQRREEEDTGFYAELPSNSWPDEAVNHVGGDEEVGYDELPLDAAAQGAVDGGYITTENFRG